MSSSTAPTSIDQQRELNEVLWGYRSELRRVEVLLEAQLLFAGAGRDHGLSVIADLLDETATKVGELDLRRELFFHPGSSTSSHVERPEPLTELSRQADDDGQTAWAEILRDHQGFLEITVRRIQDLADQSRHTQTTMLDLIAQMTTGASEPPLQRYDRSGQTVRASIPAMVFDGRA